MPLTTGTYLGSYEIVAPIGAGGMGQVYRATDPRLGLCRISAALDPMSKRNSRSIGWRPGAVTVAVKTGYPFTSNPECHLELSRGALDRPMPILT
jgi:hypothetical protein